jgi:hypothetical protein
MARLPRCDPLLDPLVRDGFAAIERGEGCDDPRDLPLVVVQIRGDCFGREERVGASRRARHFFEALLQCVSNAHGDGCGARRIHNVLHCITGGATRHEGRLRRISRSMKIGKGAREFWMRGSVERSCGLDVTCIKDVERGRTRGGGVELRIGSWLGDVRRSMPRDGSITYGCVFCGRRGHASHAISGRVRACSVTRDDRDRKSPAPFPRSPPAPFTIH